MSRYLEIPLFIILDAFGCFLLLLLLKFFFKRFFGFLAKHEFSKSGNFIKRFFNKKDISKTKVIKNLGLESFAERRRKRFETIGTLCVSFSGVFVWFLFIIILVNFFDIQSKVLVGLLGFVGVALGLGTQTVAKDVALGLLTISEDQFGVGDKVEINGIKGTVVNVSPRIVTVKEEKAKKISFIPFSQIESVSNYSREDL